MSYQTDISSGINVKDFEIRADHAGIHVASIEETSQWYHEIFGFISVPRFSNFRQGPYPRMQKISLHNFSLEVYEVMNALPFDPVNYEYNAGVKHLIFTVRDFDAWLEYVRGREDVELISEYYLSNGESVVFLLDNTGIIVRVCRDTEGITHELPGYGICCSGICCHVQDMARSILWYQELYGLELVPERADCVVCLPQTKRMRLENFTLELYEARSARPFNFVEMEYTHGVKHLDFAVKDRMGWLEYVKNRGDVEILVENHQNGSGAIYVRDNTGMLLETTRWFE